MTGKIDIKTGTNNKNSDIVLIPNLMGKSIIKEQFQNWTLTYTKDARWDIVAKAMTVMKNGYAKSRLNKTSAKVAIRFFEEHKDKHLPNKDNYSVSILGAGPSLNNLFRYKGCPIKSYHSQIIDPYSQHIEFILTLDCFSYREGVALAHKLKRIKTINSVEVNIDTLKFK